MPNPAPKCRACGAPLLWLRTPADKMMPLDPEPAPDGNVATNTAAGTCRVLGPEEAKAYPDRLHRSHFSTCPSAALFRRKP